MSAARFLVRRRFLGLNPMIYKELTQGIRNNGFLALFFLLLAVAWALLVGVVLLVRTESGLDGHSAAQCLIYAIFIFGIIVGTRAYSLTVKEVENRTFELYLVAGMSPEQLIKGKIATCLYLFFFGFCTVVPFVFSAYFLSGLDFIVMLWMMIVMIVFLTFFYFASILLAMIRSLTNTRTIITLLYYASTIFLFFFGSVFAFTPKSMHQETSGHLQAVLMGDSLQALLAWAVTAIIYAELLVIMFYWACHIVCPDSDSREHVLKLHLSGLLLLVGAMPLIGSLFELYYIGVPPRFDFASQNGIAFIYMLGLGGMMLVFWINRTDVPMLTVAAIARAGRLKRIYLYLFEPGMRGTGRLLILLGVAGPLLGFSNVLIAANMPTVEIATVMNYWLVSLVILFLGVLWRGFFERFESLRTKPGNLRTAIVVFWALAAVLAWVGQIAMQPNSISWQFPFAIGLALGWFVTPFLTHYVIGSSAPDTFIMSVSLVLGAVAFLEIFRRGRRLTPLANLLSELDRTPASASLSSAAEPESGGST